MVQSSVSHNEKATLGLGPVLGTTWGALSGVQALNCLSLMCTMWLLIPYVPYVPYVENSPTAKASSLPVDSEHKTTSLTLLTIHHEMSE